MSPEDRARAIAVARIGEAASPLAAGRVPDFFIAGHPKCGTTALYEMLKRHPQIYMPALKEPYFFVTEMRERAATRRSGALPETLQEYLSLFSDAAPGQLTGEASAYYLWSGGAARRISELRPDARVIGIFREPASFLRSLHLQLLQDHHEEEKDLSRAIELEAARRGGQRVPRSARWPMVLWYSEYVKYVEQLERYHTYFSRDQVLVVIYDDLRHDNEGSVRAILRFLGLDERYRVDAIEANPTVRMRSQRLDDLVHAVSVGQGRPARAIKAGLKAVAPRPLRREALKLVHQRIVLAAPESPDEQLMLELRRRFKPEVARLSDYLGRDLLSLWGYDRLD